MSISFGKHNMSLPTPLTILGSLEFWLRADQGITIATGVSQWNDLSGNNRHFTQGTAANQPLFVSNAINSLPAVRGDGSNDVLSTTFARVAPGTQPFYIWLIMKQISWTSGKTIIGDYTTPDGFIVDQVSPTPNIRQYNTTGANSNSGAIIGSYFRIEMQYTNSTSDYIKCGSVNVTGSNAGNDPGGGTMQIFKGGINSGTHGNVEIAEIFLFLGTPTSDQRADLDTYCTARYGAGLV